MQTNSHMYIHINTNIHMNICINAETCIQLQEYRHFFKNENDHVMLT